MFEVIPRNLNLIVIRSGISAAVFMGIISSIYKKNLKPCLAGLENISVGGAIERATNFTDKITTLSENGAKKVIVPMSNLSEISGVPLLSSARPMFHFTPITAS